MRSLLLNEEFRRILVRQLTQPSIFVKLGLSSCLTFAHFHARKMGFEKDFEKNLLLKYLKKYKWNKSKVAKLCGITRQGLNKKISKYRLDRRK